MSVPALRFKEFSASWKKFSLNDIAVKIQDGTHFSPEVFESGDYKYLTSKNVKNGYIDLSNLTYISEKAHKDIYKRCDVREGDVLLTKDGTIGQVCVNTLSEPFSMLSSVAFIRTKHTFNNYFLYHLLLSPNGQEEINKSIAGQALKRITLTKINGYIYSFPSFEEQTKIAKFLTAVDEKIHLLTQKHDLLTQYKKGVMQKIFSQELRFKDDDGQDFPEWEDGSLGDAFEYRNGKSFENEVSENGDYFLVTLNSIDITGKLKAEHKRVEKTDFSLRKNDLVMILSDVAHGNFLGLTDIIPSDKYVLNQRIGGLHPKVNLDVRFASLYINFNQKYFKLHGQGSSQLNLSKGDVLDFNLPQPHIKEQTKIANFLTAIDDKITATQTQLQAVKQYKQGLLQQMFV